MRLPILLLCGLLVAPPNPAPGTQYPVPGTRNPVPGTNWLGEPERVAPGVDLFRLDGPQPALDEPRESTAAPDGDRPPRSLRLLRLDPGRIRLSSALATGEIPGRATVLAIARRANAIAAVNAGFFAPNGDPNGLLKIDGRLLSDTGRARGAVALGDGPTTADALFDQVSARVRLRFKAGGQWRTVPIDGVDTTRRSGRLMLYTPASGATTDTEGGLEWTLRPAGAATRIVAVGGTTVATTGNAAIPEDGFVLSYGGKTAPASFAGITRAPAIQVRESLDVRSGTRVRDWHRATTIVGGAGLLIRDGTPLTEWAAEQLSPAFETTAHPRTVIARDRAGSWWLITIDGRQPGRAIGMSFREMQHLLARLDVVDALNLDGGGSTTMVVGDAVVNRPSDLIGPRAVSDAIVVLPR